MKDTSIIVKVTKSTHQEFKLACLKRGTTMSAVLRRAIDAAIAEAKRQEEAGDG